MDDETRKAVLGEALMDELKAIREYVEDVPAIKADVQALREDVGELKSDVKVIKAAVKDVSGRLQVVETTVEDHGRQLRKLRHRAA